MCINQEYIDHTLDNAPRVIKLFSTLIKLRKGVSISQKIYVGNLSGNVVNEMLAEQFAKFGLVHSAKVVTDRETHRSMGFAFVEMASSEEAETAILNLNGSVIDGRLINVTEAKRPLLH